MRPDLHTWALRVAQVVATRATCARRQVGCVLLDRHGFILSTGYNGVGPDLAHCTDKPCPGASLPSGTGLDACEAIHAEANALITCPDVKRVHGVYVTASPCVMCVKMLLRTGADSLYFIEEYPHPASAQLWRASGRGWWQLNV